MYILSEGDICVQILRTPTRDDRTRAGQKTALWVPPAGGQGRDTRATGRVLVVSGGPATPAHGIQGLMGTPRQQGCFVVPEGRMASPDEEAG